jgi:hypothetical protein
MSDQRLTAEQVRSALMGDDARLLRRRRIFRRLPSPPRCKLCAVPFAGIGGLVLRHVGFARSPGNPSLCTECLGKLCKQGMNGVEIPVTLLANTAVRLAAGAGAGEVLASVAAAEAAGLPTRERRTMHIRGRAEPIDVVVDAHRQQATR